MAGFYIWETKTLHLQLIPETALDGFKDVIVTLAQEWSEAIVEKSTADLVIKEQEGQIDVGLSQEETAKFVPGKVRIQVNLLYNDSERDTTVQGVVEARDNLHRKVMK